MSRYTPPTPKPLKKSDKPNGRLWTDFSKWTLWYGLVQQTTEFNKTGPSSTRLDTDSGTNSTSATRLQSTRLNLAKTKSMMLRFYVGGISQLSKLEIRFSSTNNMTGYLGWSLSRWKMSKGWNEVMIPLQSLTTSGSESIDNIINTIQISVTGTGGFVVFDAIEINRSSRPAVIFRFDDGWATQYSKAFPILHAHGYVGNVGVISNYVGTAGYATKTQLAELQLYGWEMFNHTANHPDLTTIDVATIKSELDVCISWMNANGFSKASDVVAYPYGSFNDNVLAAMNGYRLGMSTQEDLELSPPISPLTVKTLVINNDTQNSVYENAINTAVQTGSTVILLLHRIEDSGTDAMIYHTDKFITLVDFVASKDVDVLTITEWLK